MRKKNGGAIPQQKASTSFFAKKKLKFVSDISSSLRKNSTSSSPVALINKTNIREKCSKEALKFKGKDEISVKILFDWCIMISLLSAGAAYYFYFLRMFLL